VERFTILELTMHIAPELEEPVMRHHVAAFRKGDREALDRVTPVALEVHHVDAPLIDRSNQRRRPSPRRALKKVCTAAAH
jgi:hypothetical protein